MRRSGVRRRGSRAAGGSAAAAVTAATLALALAATGCTPTTGGPPIPPDAPAVPVPAARPGSGSSAAYGRLMDTEGRSVPGGSVTLTQPFDDNVVTVTLQLVSLGLFCLIPDAKLCPSAHRADVTDDGLWDVPRADVEPGKALRLGGQGPSGALTAVALPNGTAPVHVPDLVLWQPRVRLTPTRTPVPTAATGIRASWPALTGVPRGKAAPTYAVYATVGDPTSAQPVEVAHGLRRVSAEVPGWLTEDQDVRLSVVASTRRGRTAYGYTAPSATTTGRAVPVSRGRPCGVGAKVRERCPLTDGVLDLHVPVGDAGATPHRICVDLGRVRPVTRVVVRTPFGPVDRVVELSRDGRTYATYGRLADPGVAVGDALYDVHGPRRDARYACVRSDDFGFAGAILSEISVW